MKTQRFAMTRCAWACALSLALTACGGGGGGSPAPGSGTGTDTSTGTGTDTSGSAGSGGNTQASALQTHLGACPTELVALGDVSCMVGVYEGKTLDGSQTCGFRWTADHQATYAVGSASIAITNGTRNVNVFEKAIEASSASGFSIGWVLGAGGSNTQVLAISYQNPDEPLSAAGLVVVPAEGSGLPSCLITTAPASSSSASSANLLGRHWQAGQRLNGSAGVLATLPDRAAFDAGLADDGRAVVVFRQDDGSGRVALQVVQGTPGSAGAPPVWSAPQVLDAAAPLLTGGWARLAVSSNGHAVVMWPSQEPCGADGYQGTQTGQTCHVVYASRRLATDSAWEAPVRVAAAPLTIPDYSARINARGDVVLSFSGAEADVGDTYDATYDNMPMMARRLVGESSYRSERLNWLLTDPSTGTVPDYLKLSLGDAGELTLASPTNGTGQLMRRAFDLVTPWVPSESLKDQAYAIYDLARGAGAWAAYTDKPYTGTPTPLAPPRLNIYSPTAARWSAFDISAYTLWGDTQLVGTDTADGEFLLYSGCKLSRWHANSWSATQSLPAGCGRDQGGGLYAFNRSGDYVGIDWGGRAGQWGYYQRSGNQLLKGAPGSASGVSDDFVLGTATSVQGLGHTQLLLAANGVALVVSSNAFDRLPSASSAGSSGAAADRLWAAYLR